MHRTQILLEDEQYERLKAEAARTGRSIGELVRDAVDTVFRRARQEEMLEAFDEAFGAADADDFDGLSGEEYVDKVRSGWSRRWVERGWNA